MHAISQGETPSHCSGRVNPNWTHPDGLIRTHLIGLEVSSSALAPPVITNLGPYAGMMLPMWDVAELVSVALTDEQIELLDRGLVEWGGPARCTDAMAVAMGFVSVQDLFDESDRLLADLNARRPLSRWDWSRTLIATEIVFVSDVIGSGAEWPITTGLDDLRSFQVLREVQRQLVGVVVPIAARGGYQPKR